VLATFEGQLWWMNIAGWIAGFLLFGGASVMAWWFVHAPNLEDMLRWGSALGFAAQLRRP
jgi:hypothetical protein